MLRDVTPPPTHIAHIGPVRGQRSGAVRTVSRDMNVTGLHDVGALSSKAGVRQEQAVTWAA